MQITGNTMLITGSTSGIGRGLAEAFHRRGNQVIIIGRRQALLDEITAANPGMAGFRVDVTDPEALKPFASQVMEHFPELNVLINNAGIARMEDFTADAPDVSIAEGTIQTNILGVLHTTAVFLPVLRKQPQATIITTTSGLAFVPLVAAPTYCASKAFLHSWLQSLRAQIGDVVEVLELAPPYVQTELGGPQQATDPQAMPLADFIDEVIHILETKDTPDGEILVERVKMLRWAERDGNYRQMQAMLAPLAGR